LVTDRVQKLEQSRGARAGKLERPQRSGVQARRRPRMRARAGASSGGSARGGSWRDRPWTTAGAAGGGDGWEKP
jgi:hypothetical protein